ncbi:hypothetical protein DFH09DRAFT_1088681 [Mycena vulgaris]|nr:hypothetical protein DFH09DRAFT_1088681 [Mycena vulgaris]
MTFPGGRRSLENETTGRWQHASRGQREGDPVESNKYHSSESGYPQLLRVKSDLQHERACMTSSSNPEAPAAGSTLVPRGKCNHLMAQLATEERCRGASDWKAQLHGDVMQLWDP